MLMKRSTLRGTRPAIRVGSSVTIRSTGTPARLSHVEKRIAESPPAEWPTAMIGDFQVSAL
jgi:hypothetical protein